MSNGINGSGFSRVSFDAFASPYADPKIAAERCFTNITGHSSQSQSLKPNDQFVLRLIDALRTVNRRDFDSLLPQMSEFSQSGKSNAQIITHLLDYVAALTKLQNDNVNHERAQMMKDTLKGLSENQHRSATSGNGVIETAAGSYFIPPKPRNPRKLDYRPLSASGEKNTFLGTSAAATFILYFARSSKPAPLPGPVPFVPVIPVIDNSSSFPRVAVITALFSVAVGIIAWRACIKRVDISGRPVPGGSSSSTFPGSTTGTGSSSTSGISGSGTASSGASGSSALSGTTSGSVPASGADGSGDGSGDDESDKPLTEAQIILSRIRKKRNETTDYRSPQPKRIFVDSGLLKGVTNRHAAMNGKEPEDFSVPNLTSVPNPTEDRMTIATQRLAMLTREKDEMTRLYQPDLDTIADNEASITAITGSTTITGTKIIGSIDIVETTYAKAQAELRGTPLHVAKKTYLATIKSLNEQIAELNTANNLLRHKTKRLGEIGSEMETLSTQITEMSVRATPVSVRATPAPAPTRQPIPPPVFDPAAISRRMQRAPKADVDAWED